MAAIENQLNVPNGREHADSLLDKVFSAVKLPETDHNKINHDEVLKELDHVLSKHWDEDPVATVVTQHVLSEHENHEHLDAKPRSRHPSMLEEALQNANGVSRLLTDDVEEEHRFGVFPSDGPIDTTPMTYVASSERKIRSMTVDSQVSAAESRFGEFDLTETSELNLNHPIVAYQGIESKGPEEVGLVDESEEQEIAPEVPPHKNELPLPSNNFTESLLREIRNSEFNEIESQRLETKARSPTYDSIYSQSINENGNGNGTNGFVVASPVPALQMHQEEQHYIDIPEIHSPRSKAEFNSYTQSERDYQQAIERDFQKIQLNRKKTPFNPLPRSLSTLTVETKQGNAAEKKGPLQIIEEVIPVGPQLEYQIKNAEIIGTQASVTFYQPYFEVNAHPNFPEIIVGGPTRVTDEKVLFLIGKTGAGKTSLIYSLLNFVYGCKREHAFRLALELPERFEKILDRVITYTFTSTILPYNLTVIDTPGIELESTPLLIGKWVKHRLTRDSRLRLDAIVPVIPTFDDAVDPGLSLNYRKVKYLFGDDLRTNVLPIITYAEGLDFPDALKALKTLKLPFTSYYKINNLGSLPHSGKTSGLKHSLLYKHNIVSFEELVEDLESVVTPLLLSKSA
ncbi:unnamed protein product [Bursaphelenchus xylophilus]|uniref:(pine wood nematode) hypothetical protein n=1 Tax=Bursaphelenchus xylophilus TaxID=6326 RepID=A0A1I7SUH8_BURXY|nr:unnamed protein product [Bursaphelenchus xylophilus]CAG9107112.1 unnamed protein product [Bursaphelenchus xylophilus]